jgi:hypothetical protein
MKLSLSITRIGIVERVISIKSHRRTTPEIPKAYLLFAPSLISEVELKHIAERYSGEVTSISKTTRRGASGGPGCGRPGVERSGESDGGGYWLFLRSIRHFHQSSELTTPYHVSISLGYDMVPMCS